MTAAPVSSRTATRVLASTEARLLSHMPALWAGFVLAVALCAVWNGGASPTWETFAANSGRASLVLAGFLLLIGHLATSRDHRNGAAEFTGTLPASPRRRAVALFAFLPVAAAAGLLAEGVELLILVPSRLSGSFDPWLVAEPVVVPMAGAALGIAAGLWRPSAPVGPLTLFAAAAVLATLPILGSGPGDLPWLLFPIVMDRSAAPDATGWHVLYLVALLTVVIGAALARHWRLWATIVVTIALIVAVVAVRRQQMAQPATDRIAAMSHLG
ncbi:hypothetical protein GCM10010435_61200 [Winogradskya consettensis]|uniref:Uncharacterized protein n=1 Tax=Winogradskya consettensis TaxID=113560 RepID=A0A919SQ24_9ACTN|nr:hypothetical protein [Actinoplanes consettensis]GIM76235.1 hypothetical protein Aco04nite_49360 [Actinoplanes consettensis]